MYAKITLHIPTKPKANKDPRKEKEVAVNINNRFYNAITGHLTMNTLWEMGCHVTLTYISKNT